jgi:hypothetical protein
MMAIINLLSKLSGPIARIINKILDYIEKSPVANAEWQKLRERVFYKYSNPANASKDANEIENHLEEHIRKNQTREP